MKNRQLTLPDLQKFIKNRMEVGKAISPEDIEVALGKLRYAGFIKIVGTSFEGMVFEKDKT